MSDWLCAAVSQKFEAHVSVLQEGFGPVVLLRRCSAFVEYLNVTPGSHSGTRFFRLYVYFFSYVCSFCAVLFFSLVLFFVVLGRAAATRVVYVLGCDGYGIVPVLSLTLRRWFGRTLEVGRAKRISTRLPMSLTFSPGRSRVSGYLSSCSCPGSLSVLATA